MSVNKYETIELIKRFNKSETFAALTERERGQILTALRAGDPEVIGEMKTFFDRQDYFEAHLDGAVAAYAKEIVPAVIMKDGIRRIHEIAEAEIAQAKKDQATAEAALQRQLKIK